MYSINARMFFIKRNGINHEKSIVREMLADAPKAADEKEIAATTIKMTRTNRKTITTRTSATKLKQRY